MTNPITCGGELPPCGNCEDCNTAIRADMTYSTRKTARELAGPHHQCPNDYCSCPRLESDDPDEWCNCGVDDRAAAIEKALREAGDANRCPCGEAHYCHAEHEADVERARREGYEAGAAAVREALGIEVYDDGEQKYICFHFEDKPPLRTDLHGIMVDRGDVDDAKWHIITGEGDPPAQGRRHLSRQRRGAAKAFTGFEEPAQEGDDGTN